MKKAIIGKKVGMTQIFDETGKVIPVTVIEAGPCVVVQKMTTEKEGYKSVQLGFDAANTLGNARETQEWARAMRFDSLIVVTADYHMPRAMLELRGAMPDKRLTPYPVSTSVMNAGRWWRTSGAARLMVTEYCKYLAILGREAVLGLGPRNEPAPPKKG